MVVDRSEMRALDATEKASRWQDLPLISPPAPVAAPGQGEMAVGC